MPYSALGCIIAYGLSTLLSGQNLEEIRQLLYIGRTYSSRR
jgi:hypothetical protein